MPLFGKRHTNSGRVADGRRDAYDGRNAVTTDPYDTQYGAGRAATQPGTNPATYQAQDQGVGSGTYQQRPAQYNSQAPQTGPAQTDPYYANANAPTGTGTNVAPVSHFSSGRARGSGSSMTGKMERALGTMLCSRSLKNKGMEKERAAQARQSQRSEILEAEKLEHEALVRRDRAVAYGADPANRILGGPAEAQAASERQNMGYRDDIHAPKPKGPVLV